MTQQSPVIISLLHLNNNPNSPAVARWWWQANLFPADRLTSLTPGPASTSFPYYAYAYIYLSSSTP